MILARPIAIATVIGAATIVAACGTSDGGTEGDGRSPVVATTSIWADIVSAVACGADVPTIIPAGADPHTFEPSLRDREALERATTVVTNGLDLEAPLHDLLVTIADADVEVLEMTDHVAVLDGEGDDSDGDPHIWQDPRRVADTLDAIATAVTADGLPDCAEAYRAQLGALDDEIERLLAPLPPSARVMVTSHDSLAYFADRYDMEVVGTVIPSTSTIAEANAADLAALAATIERYHVRAIFTEELHSTADADALAARLGIAVIPLVTDALGDDPDTDTYLGMMRHNAATIAEALAP